MPGLTGWEAGQWEPNRSPCAAPKWGHGWGLEQKVGNKAQDSEGGRTTPSPTQELSFLQLGTQTPC